MIAAVLPFTTFTGHAFHPLVRYLVTNYEVKTIVTGWGRSSFSEDTSLTECLFVAQKKTIQNDHRFNLVGLLERTEKWQEKTIRQIAEMAMKGVVHGKVGVVKRIPQSELLPECSTLSGLVLRMVPDYGTAWKC